MEQPRAVKPRRPVKPPTIEIVIPNKPSFSIMETSELCAQYLGGSVEAARVKLYRAIGRGELPATRHLGHLRISYAGVVRILKGEEV